MSRGAPPFSLHFAVGLLASLVAMRAVAGVAEDRDPWRLLAQHRPRETLDALAGKPRQQSRGDLLAVLTARLALATGSDVKLRAIAIELTQLAHGTDDIAAAASYLTARIEQVHRTEPDYAHAARLFDATAARFPQSEWGQLSLVKLAVLELYVLPGRSPESRVAAARALLPRVTRRELQRDLHLIIGRATVDLEQPVRDALVDLRAAEAAGGLPEAVRAELQLQIGVLSRRIGENEQAARYLRRFLARSAADPRAYTARQELASALGSQGVNAP